MRTTYVYKYFQNLQYFIANPANENNIIPYILEIKENATDKEYEIIFVNDGSKDNTKEESKEEKKEITTEPKRRGRPAQRALHRIFQ
mgnify:CR=1 FL=1